MSDFCWRLDLYHYGLRDLFGDAAVAYAPAAKLSAVSLEWKPLRVLEAVFGKNAKVAYDSCYAWAQGPESLKDAISNALLWACEYRGDLRSKPAKYVKQSITRALQDANRKESLESWQRKRRGDKRVWERDYYVELIDPQGPAYNEDGQEKTNEPTTYLNDPSLRSPSEMLGIPESVIEFPLINRLPKKLKRGAKPERDDYIRRLIAGEVDYVCDKIDSVAAQAIRLTDVDGYSQNEAAEMLGVPKRTLSRHIKDLRAQLRRLVVWHPRPVHKQLTSSAEGSGGRGAVWYNGA